MLTTATTSVGLVPLWIGGTIMWEPMAVVINCQTISSESTEFIICNKTKCHLRKLSGYFDQLKY